MACRGNVIEHIENWCDNFSHDSTVTPQSATLLFSSITFKEKMAFFKAWVDHSETGGYLAYDVTSFSTYAKGVSDSEWGYNRDGEKLPQINLGCYLSFQSCLPLLYVTYPGSIVDKSNLRYIMQYNSELGISNATFIMDRGFCSTSNMRWLHAEEIPYVIAVDSLHKTTRTAIDEVRDGIATYQFRCGKGVFGKTLHSRYYGVRTAMHVFFSPELHEKKRLDLYRLVDSIKEKLEQSPRLTPKEARKYSRFYDITFENKDKFSYSINYNKIMDFEKNCGFFVFVRILKIKLMLYLIFIREKIL
jgi:transposase